MKTFEEYASLGGKHDIMDALRLLTEAYVQECGISLGYRTVAYYAAEIWHEKLAWEDLPLSEQARKDALYVMMSQYSSSYVPEEYDQYDICAMNDEELTECCEELINVHEFSEPTLEVLCYGILQHGKQEFNISHISAVADDGTELHGRVVDQSTYATNIVMDAPYKDIKASKYELVRDARPLLIEAYNDYKLLTSTEAETRELY